MLLQKSEMSLRNQLLLRVIFISIILVGGTAWFAYKNVVFETQELFDAQLSRSARVILSLAQAQNGDSGFSKIQGYLDENGLSVMYINFDESDDFVSDKGHIYETKLAFQIWDNEGNLVVKSYNAPLEPMDLSGSGFSSKIIGNFQWRTFSLMSSNGQYRCITAERIDVRNDLIDKVVNDLFYLLVILVPALALVIYISIDSGLKPLQRLASQIDELSGNNLDDITSEYKFSEIITIKNALNQLLHRLKETLAREKRITSDAAHELRTPLAAIRLHAELAKIAKKKKQQDESLDQVIHSVDRSTHLVEQLLTLARLEPELLAKDFTAIDLSALIVEECALVSPLALEKKIELSFKKVATSSFKGNDPALRLLICNVVSNAISFSPDGGKISIDLNEESNQFSLVITDNGPGISEQDRQRVMERFYRAENHQVIGCGIGLSIVDRVVQMHDGSIVLTDGENGTGLKVSIFLPKDKLEDVA